MKLLLSILLATLWSIAMFFVGRMFGVVAESLMGIFGLIVIAISLYKFLFKED